MDVAEIRRRIEAERAKRLRPDGSDQFVGLSGAFEDLNRDPQAGTASERPSLDEEIDCLILGGGFGGLLAGAAMRRAGLSDFRIVEIAGDFGGTWYWNRYPGIRCDVESYIYLPLLEETGYVPTERYIRGDEIFEYCRLLGRTYDLYDRALFNASVTSIIWDEERSRWLVSTGCGDRFLARFVMTQSGLFTCPQLPALPGIESFSGHMFHSARWDYDYTGGAPGERLGKLSGKTIGVIGTGATAVQLIPELAKTAEEVIIFQRTPSAVGVRDNGPTDREWFAAQPLGWQKERIADFTRLACGEEALGGIDDGWTRFFQRLIDARKQPVTTDGIIGPDAEEIADLEYGSELRERVDQFVSDARKSDLLKAYYRTLCKRPCFSDDYLPAVARDNVRLVDAASGVKRITPAGVVVDDVEYELDCIIFCTGFRLGASWADQAGYDIVGRKGTRISEKWSKGVSTFQGLFSHEFPNIFFMGTTQTGVTFNYTEMLSEQIEHAMTVISKCMRDGIETFEASIEAEQKWQSVMSEKYELQRPFKQACTPGYFNAEGNTGDRRNALASGVFAPATEFFRLREEWRRSGDFEGLVFKS